MASSKIILIAGAGVIGLCVAHYAQRKGHRVILVERGAPSHDSCSLGNAGMIVPSHFVPLAAPGMIEYGLRTMWQPESPFYIRPRIDKDLIDWGLKFRQAATAERVAKAAPVLRDLNMSSRQCYVEMAGQRNNDFGLAQRGLVMLCKREHALHEESEGAKKANALGIPAEVMTPEALAKLDPNVTMDAIGGVYYPKDCHLSPQQFVAGLTRELIANGAEFHWQTEVTGWRMAGDCAEAVITSKGDVQADEYVIAGGAWTPQVARGLQANLPMQAGKGYSLTMQRPRQLPKICAIFVEARVAVTPMGGTLRFGGTMEVTGLDESINPARVRGIINAVPRYYPDFKVEDFNGIEPWRGLRPVSPDGMPYVGRLKRYKNLSVAAGHAMMGLSLAPITGKLMSEVLSGETPSLDMTLLDPNRYA
jgi:D-amino-acid dehydrogenase